MNLEAISYPYIVTGGVVITIVAVADVERAVGILIIEIVGTRFADERVSIIGFSIPYDTLNPHRRMTGIKYLKLPVFITAIKDKTFSVFPSQTSVTYNAWLLIPAPCIFATILHNYCYYLLFRVCNMVVTV